MESYFWDMDSSLNMELRSEILEISLKIEFEINRLIIKFLGIEKENTNAFSNKSSSFSFKNKIDLLYDLDILDKEEHLKLELISIFRNQFMHNLNCNSFETATNIMDSQFKKKLLKFYGSEPEVICEEVYRLSYRELYLSCMETILSKHEKRLDVIEEKYGILDAINSLSMFYIDYFFGIFNELKINCAVEEGDEQKLIELKEKIITQIDTKSRSIFEDEKYKALVQVASKIGNDDILKSILKI